MLLNDNFRSNKPEMSPLTVTSNCNYLAGYGQRMAQDADMLLKLKSATPQEVQSFVSSTSRFPSTLATYCVQRSKHATGPSCFGCNKHLL